MGLNWFVLRVQSGREDRICETLQKRIHAAVISGTGWDAIPPQYRDWEKNDYEHPSEKHAAGLAEDPKQAA